jgi:hypothetical protein
MAWRPQQDDCVEDHFESVDRLHLQQTMKSVYTESQINDIDNGGQ